MKRLFVMLPMCIAAASPLHAAEPEKHLDVLRWFDGCTALSETQIALTMDHRCMVSAYKYCEIGRPETERRPCHDSLTAHIQRKTEDIASSLPEKVTGLGKFEEYSYDVQLKVFREDVFEVDCSAVEDFQCEALGIFARWIVARELARTSGVTEGMDTK